MSRRSWIPLLPALLLLTVALMQLELAVSHTLSPWKGGGFGMFSSTDRGHNRRLRAWVYGPERHEEVAIPAPLVRHATDALVFPSPGRLEALAREIARSASFEDGRITQVRVAVWRREYDPETLEPSWVLLVEVLHNVADPRP